MRRKGRRDPGFFAVSVSAGVGGRFAHPDGQAIEGCGRKTERSREGVAIRVSRTTRKALLPASGGGDAGIRKPQGISGVRPQPGAVGGTHACLGAPQSGAREPRIARSARSAARVADPELVADGALRVDARVEDAEQSHTIR